MFGKPPPTELRGSKSRRLQPKPARDNRTTSSDQAILDYILHHAQGDERPYLTVEIYGVKLQALLDSGATNTILGSQGWALVRKMNCKIQPSNQNCTVANGN
jgi:hypothetical protein